MTESYEKLFDIFTNSLKKPDVSDYDRARLIKEYLDKNSLSIRAFSKRFGFSHSTIDDWLRVLRIPEQEHRMMIASGLRPSDIYRALRATSEEESKGLTEIDLRIVALSEILLKVGTIKKTSQYTMAKLDDLRKAISTFEFRLEHKQ